MDFRIATVAVGLLAFFVLVDFPATVSFLTPEERAFIIVKKKYDNLSVGEESSGCCCTGGSEAGPVYGIVVGVGSWSVGGG